MAMRNFWIEGTVDGRRTELSGGPQRADGGFSLVVYQRDEGCSVAALRVTGREVNGQLYLDVETAERDADHGTPVSFRVVTER